MEIGKQNHKGCYQTGRCRIHKQRVSLPSEMQTEGDQNNTLTNIGKQLSLISNWCVQRTWRGCFCLEKACFSMQRESFCTLEDINMF